MFGEKYMNKCQSLSTMTVTCKLNLEHMSTIKVSENISKTINFISFNEFFWGKHSKVKFHGDHNQHTLV